jgi:hypothetical protein
LGGNERTETDVNLTDRYILSALFARGTASRVHRICKDLHQDLMDGMTALKAAKMAYFYGLFPAEPGVTDAMRLSHDLILDVKRLRASLKRLVDLGFVDMKVDYPSARSRLRFEMFAITAAGEIEIERISSSLPSRPGYVLKDVDVREAAESVRAELNTEYAVTGVTARGFPVKVRLHASGAVHGTVEGCDHPCAKRIIRALPTNKPLEAYE